MKPHVKYGLLAGLICAVLYTSDTYIDNPTVHDVFSWGSYFGLAAMIYLAAKERRELQNDRLSFGEGFGTGAMVTIIGAAITAVVFYLNAKFFNRAFIENAKLEAEEALENKYSSDEQVEMALQMIGPGMLSFTHFIIVAIIGIIAALIVAAIVRKENRNPMMDDNEGPDMRA